jgi:hypothetical protein
MGRHEPRPVDAPFLCARCGSPRVVDFTTQVVCSVCGAVMPAGPDPGPEPEPEPEPEPDHAYPNVRPAR